MKYMLKRIFIGVAIGTILFLIKGGNVFAASSSQAIDSSSFNAVVLAKYDVCSISDSFYALCVNGFEKTYDIYNRNTTIQYANDSNVLGVRELSIDIEFPSGKQPTIYQYANFSDISFMFGRQQSDTWKSGYLTRAITSANRFPIYVRLETTDNTICEPTNFGSSISLSSSSDPQSDVQMQPYFEVPSECRSKSLKKLVITYSPGINYNGPSSSILSQYVADLPFNASNFINTYRNNTYLFIYNKTSINTIENNISIRFNSSSYPSNWSRVEIKENLSKLEKELYLASLGGTDLGPSNASSSEMTKVDNEILSITSGLGTAIGGGDFNSFLSALVLKPIQELQWTIRNDNLTADGSAIACPSTTRLYFSYSRSINDNMNKWSMELPCMSNVYANIPFVGTGQLFSLVDTWHIILMGYLYYLLVLTWVNVVKYTFTASKSEIEVVEL